MGSPVMSLVGKMMEIVHFSVYYRSCSELWVDWRIPCSTTISKVSRVPSENLIKNKKVGLYKQWDLL